MSLTDVAGGTATLFATLLVTALLTAGCGAATATPDSKLPVSPEHLDAVEGYSLSFPGKVSTRTGREGPFVFRVDWARTGDGARFEAAWFGFPEELAAGDRDALMERVLAGLSGPRGTTVVSRARLAEQALGARGGAGETVDLVLDREDGKRGFHRVMYPSPSAMLQVSAVGPQGGAWEKEVPAFLASVSLPGDAGRALLDGPTAPASRAMLGHEHPHRDGFVRAHRGGGDPLLGGADAALDPALSHR